MRSLGLTDTLLNIKEINKGLLYTTGNYYIQYLVKTYNGEESEKEYMFICIYITELYILYITELYNIITYIIYNSIKII